LAVRANLLLLSIFKYSILDEHLETLLEGQRIGLVSAHPDDHLVHSNALAIARKLGLAVYELTLTRGRASTVNHHADSDFVLQGRREQEGIQAALALGIQSNEHWDVADGFVPGEQTRLVPRVRSWMEYRALDAVLTLGGVTDHTDHIASGHIARTASHQLGVVALELQLDGRGEWHAPTLKSAQEVAMDAALVHVSQFTKDSLEASLGQYPIWRDATYVLHTASDLIY